MDAGRPKSIVDQIQSLSGIEDDSFKDFILDILRNSGSEDEETTLENLRLAIAQYLQKEMGVLTDTH